MRYEFKQTGSTPLLMHADDINSADAMELWRNDPKNKGVSKRGDDRSPAWTWIGYLYHDGERVVIPAENLQKCLSQGGAKMILKGKKTFKEAAVSGIWIEQEHIPLVVGGKEVSMSAVIALRDETDFPVHLTTARKMGFDLLTKRARIGAAKHIRVRPVFAGWSLTGTVEVDADVKEMTKDSLAEIFHHAGRVGLGDWRPGCPTPGRYGMFTATVKPIKG